MKKTLNQSLKETPALALPSPVLETDVYVCNVETYKKNLKTEWYEEDYKSPVYTEYGGSVDFELWYTERFGWCIPTLTIRNVSGRARARGAETRRSYAISIRDEKLVSCGMGPHVKRHVTIRVKESRFEALKPLLDLRIRGQEKAGDCRDRRSTRAANTRAHRAEMGFLRGW
jgi:hypothetical protein